MSFKDKVVIITGGASGIGVGSSQTGRRVTVTNSDEFFSPISTNNAFEMLRGRQDVSSCRGSRWSCPEADI